MESFSGKWLALTSSVGRRTLSAFFVATLIPSLSVALLASYTHDNNNAKQTIAQLQHDSRAFGLTILSQLRTASDLLSLIADDPNIPESLVGRNVTPIFDELEIQFFNDRTKANLPRIIIGDANLSGNRKIAIAVPINSDQLAGNSFLVGWLPHHYLWKMGELVSNTDNSCVFLPTGTKLFCTNSNSPPIELMFASMNASSTGIFQWKSDDQDWQTNYWELFLTGQFEATPWIITQTRDNRPSELWILDSNGYYASILLILILSPLLVASIQIRKTMQPIDGLMDGIQRIARRDHTQSIAETGPIEFARLANSINKMSSKINSQISTLSSFSEIDRILLSKKDLSAVCQLLIRLLVDQQQLLQATVVLLNNKDHRDAEIYRNIPGEALVEESRWRLTDDDLTRLNTIWSATPIETASLPAAFRISCESEYLSAVYPITINSLPRAFLVVSISDGETDPSTTELIDGCLERLALALETIDRTHKLEFHASRDELTELANKRLLGERLQEALIDIDSAKSEGALLYIDLDFFKSVNDIAGHIVGDRALAIVGHRIERIFSAGSTVARIGGDEFVVLIPCTSTDIMAAEAADEIIRALSHPIAIAGVAHQLGASIGIAKIPADGKDLEELLFKADLAMYEAKKAGRNNWKYYQSEMKAVVQARVSFESELRRAVERNEFRLYVQPQMNIRTGRVIGGEVLLRWFHKDRGPISPVEFIPVAEETGLIIPLGEWVLLESARMLTQWQDADLAIEKLAVNVSLKQFMNSSFKKSVEKAISISGEYSSALEIEITESLFATDACKTIEICEWIKNRGLSIAIDDFGTGYSSLSYLNMLPFDTLKIDRLFIEQIDSDPPETKIIEMILDLGKHLSKNIVAEGVSSQTQLQFLQGRQCQLVQGFLIAEPVAPKEFSKLVGKTPYYDKLNSMTTTLRMSETDGETPDLVIVDSAAAMEHH